MQISLLFIASCLLVVLDCHSSNGTRIARSSLGSQVLLPRQKRNETRRIEPDEIIPHGAVQSGTIRDKSADRAIDHDLSTYSLARRTGDSPPWIKLLFDKVYCIHEVRRHSAQGKMLQRWSCRGTGCSCTGTFCHFFEELMVEMDEEDAKFPPAMSNCIKGHTVKLQKVDRDRDVSNEDKGPNLRIRELSVFGTLICRAGLWKNSRGSCVPCPANQYSIAGAASCINCPLGMTANKNRTRCETSRLILILWSLLGVFTSISVILVVVLAQKYLKKRCTCSCWTKVPQQGQKESCHNAPATPLEMVPLPAQSIPPAAEPEALEIIYNAVEPVTAPKSTRSAPEDPIYTVPNKLKTDTLQEPEVSTSSTQDSKETGKDIINESCHSAPATPLGMVPLPAQSIPPAAEPEALDIIYNAVDPVTSPKSVSSEPADPIYTVPNKLKTDTLQEPEVSTSSTQDSKETGKDIINESCHSAPATPLEMVPLPAQSIPPAAEPEALEIIYNAVDPVTAPKSTSSAPEDPIYTALNKLKTDTLQEPEVSTSSTQDSKETGKDIIPDGASSFKVEDPKIINDIEKETKPESDTPGLADSNSNAKNINGTGKDVMPEDECMEMDPLPVSEIATLVAEYRLYD